MENKTIVRNSRVHGLPREVSTEGRKIVLTEVKPSERKQPGVFPLDTLWIMKVSICWGEYRRQCQDKRDSVPPEDISSLTLVTCSLQSLVEHHFLRNQRKAELKFLALDISRSTSKIAVWLGGPINNPGEMVMPRPG